MRQDFAKFGNKQSKYDRQAKRQTQNAGAKYYDREADQHTLTVEARESDVNASGHAGAQRDDRTAGYDHSEKQKKDF